MPGGALYEAVRAVALAKHVRPEPGLQRKRQKGRDKTWRSLSELKGEISVREAPPQVRALDHPGGNPGANLKSISHRCHPILVACVWELTKNTINLPLGCLQGGERCLALLQPGGPTVLKSTCWVCGKYSSPLEAGSYLRLIDSCITQLKAQGPSRTCNESKEDEEGRRRPAGVPRS